MSNLAFNPSVNPSPADIISFPKQKHYNSRPGNHNHTQQRVSPIRDPEQVNEVFKALLSSGRYGLRNACIFALQLAIGRRTNDILQMTLKDVFDFSTLQIKFLITVDEHKTGKTARDMPLNSMTRNLLFQYIQTLKVHSPDAYLFPSQKSNPDGTQRPLNTSSLDGIYKKYTAPVFATLDTPQTHISSYAARKTFGYNIYTTCMRNHNGQLPGTDINALQYVQSVFNHESTMTTLRYIGAYDAPAMDLAESIGEQYNF